ncbi:hypothetical protein [Pseudomonas brassicacearum]|uniref:hypothetical protein n=1 Tax=Pseudomonas brassicacearum TaxID=930166 RepID=UPI0007201D5F|nr:hypothetical protein [Pseudomonas brassicacearum]ALQ05951.1 hypothetical protein AK973_5502 [Pseudomonas brassicacearum]
MPNVLVVVWDFDTRRLRVPVENSLLCIQLRIGALLYMARTAFAKHIDRHQLDYCLVVAPEYLFSKEMPVSFISEEEKEIIRATLIDISKINPWLILVPGTTLWFKSMLRPDSRKLKRGTQQLKSWGQARNINKAKYGAEIDAVVNEIPERDRMNKGVYGDYAKATKERIAKIETDGSEAGSGIVRNTGFIIWNGNVFYQHKRYPNIGNDGLEELNDAQFWEDKIFMPGSYRETPAIHGLQMALEICAEHFIGATVLHKNNVLDFHILVSASIVLDKGRVGVKHGGYVVHADSESSAVYRREGMNLVQLQAIDETEIGLLGVEAGRVRSFVCAFA